MIAAVSVFSIVLHGYTTELFSVKPWKPYGRWSTTKHWNKSSLLALQVGPALPPPPPRGASAYVSQSRGISESLHCHYNSNNVWSSSCFWYVLRPSVGWKVHGLEPYFYISCTQGMGPDHNSLLHQILEVVSLTIWYILDISLSSIALNSTAIDYACFCCY